MSERQTEGAVGRRAALRAVTVLVVFGLIAAALVAFPPERL